MIDLSWMTNLKYVSEFDMERVMRMICKHFHWSQSPLAVSFISSDESLKSKMLAFSSILVAVTDLGMTTTPLWVL